MNNKMSLFIKVGGDRSTVPSTLEGGEGRRFCSKHLAVVTHDHPLTLSLHHTAPLPSFP